MRTSNFFGGVEQAIAKERQRQDLKWGLEHDSQHRLGDWLSILHTEIDEAYYASTKAQCLTEIIHVAAVAMACLEHFGIPKELKDV